MSITKSFYHSAAKPSRRRALTFTVMASLMLGACSQVTESTLDDAQNAFEQGDYRIARAHLADIFSNGEASDAAYLLQMRLMLELDEGYAAMVAAEKVSESALNGHDRRTAIAHALLLQAKPESAIELYQDVEPGDFQEQDFRMALWALKYMGQVEEFGVGMDEALDRFPASVDLNTLAAHQMLDQGAPDAASPFAMAALAGDSDNYGALIANGRLAIAQGQLEKALGYYSSAAEHHGHRPLPWAVIAGLHLDLDQVEEAGEKLDTALAAHPDYPFLQWQQARYALEKDDMLTARTALEKARRHFRDNDEFTLFSAQFEEKAGNPGLAAAEYRRYLRAVGPNPEIEAQAAELEQQADT